MNIELTRTNGEVRWFVFLLFKMKIIMKSNYFLSHGVVRRLVAVLWMVILSATSTAAFAKSSTHETFSLPARYSVAPFPVWFKPLPVDANSEFRKGEDRYLSRQMAARVDARGWAHVVYHQVMEIRSKDHPWIKGPKADIEPIVFDSFEQALVLHALKVHRNGRVIDYTRTVYPEIIGENAPFNYPGDLTVRSAHFQLPRLKIGDQLELAYSRATFQLSSSFRSPLQVFWQAPDNLGLTYPVVLERQQFQWSIERPHRPVEVPRSDQTNSLSRQWVREESELQGWKQVAWTARRIAPMATESVSKGHTPNDVLPYDLVGVAEFAEGVNSGDEFLQSYLAVPAPKSAAYAALLELLRREPTSAKQAIAALRWVQSNMQLHLDRRPTPMSADEVLAAEKGDCKDVSMLLWTLMRGLGIEAEVAGLSLSMARWPSKLGSLANFDHVVVVVWIDEKPYVLDGTLTDGMVAAPPMPLERMGNFYANYDLRIAHGPRAGYVRIPPSTNIEDRTRRIDQRTEVGADGKTLMVTTSLIFSGAMADYWRGYYANESEEARRKLFMAEMKDIDPKDRWLEPLKIEDDAVSNRLALHARTQYGVKLRKNSEGNFLIDFRMQPFFDLLTDHSDSETRVNPLRLPFDREQRAYATHTLVLPKGWKVYEAPRSETVATSSMRVNYARKSEAKADGTEVIDTLELNLFSDRVLPADFPAYKAAVDKVVRLTGDIRFGP